MVVGKMWCTECLPNALTEEMLFCLHLVGTEIYTEPARSLPPQENFTVDTLHGEDCVQW